MKGVIKIKVLDNHDNSPVVGAEVKNNGTLVGFTNEAGELFFHAYSCTKWEFSAEKLPVYKAVSFVKTIKLSEIITIKIDAIRVSSKQIVYKIFTY